MSYLVGGKLYTNGEITIKLRDDEPIPDGFYKGISKEFKKNISKGAKGRQWWHNPINGDMIHIRKGEKPPKGYIRGTNKKHRKNVSKVLLGRQWWHDPITQKEIFINPNETPIPEGYVKGHSEKYKRNMSIAKTKKGKNNASIKF